MSFVVGLTGPTGAGKSSVTEVAEDLDFKVIDCDKLARVAVEKGSAGLDDLVLAFGADILNPDGALNRKALARKAFSYEENTQLLNKTILPHIVALVHKEAVGEKILLDAPTLFESGIDSICDEVIVVLCDEKIRKKRIMNRDNLDEADAELRIKAGKDDKFYVEKTNNIVYNDCELSVFNLKIQKLLNKLLEENKNV